jgi:hypothetical protein
VSDGGGVERLGLGGRRGDGRSWLEAEWRAALDGLTLEDARLLAKHGLPLAALVAFGFEDYARLVGCMPMRIEGRLWEPDPAGHRGFVTPVRSRGDARDMLADDIIISGPLVDLVAWHPETPQQWATRAGIADWLGAWDPGLAHDRKAPVQVWRAPLGWLRAWCDGVVPLTADRAELYWLLVDMPAIDAEDAAHAAELRWALQRPYPVPPPVYCRKAAT